MQGSKAPLINTTRLSNFVTFYMNSILHHLHSHSSVYYASMSTNERLTAEPSTVPSPTRRNTRRIREGGIRKVQSPKKRKNATYRDIAARFHPLIFPRLDDVSSYTSDNGALFMGDAWDPIRMIKDTFGEDCTYLDFPQEKENPPVEFPWSKEAAAMVADANFVYDVCCEPYKHLYSM